MSSRYTQSTQKVIEMTQALYDAITFERLQVYPSAELRTAAINTVVKLNSSGMQITKGHSSDKQTDVVTALAMAVWACTRQATKIDWAHKWRAYDPLHRDDDLPPLPPPAPQAAPRAYWGGDWWQSPAWRKNESDQKIPGVDRSLVNHLLTLDTMLKSGWRP
jgi:hypothetical protein